MRGRSISLFLVCAVVTHAGWSCPEASAHEGPDPVASWRFDHRHVRDGQATAILGPNLDIHGEANLDGEGPFESLRLDGKDDLLQPADSAGELPKILPDELLTVSAWVAIDAPQRWGGIVGCIQDNGGEEQGWLLGYNNKHFTFALASEGANDGDGKLTYLSGTTSYQPGKLYHIVASYDGKKMSLFVNGKLDATSNVQTGPIHYPQDRILSMGAYRDSDEHHRLRGRLREIKIYGAAATEKWVAHDFELDRDLVALPADIEYEPNALAVLPYLQYGTAHSMTVMWKTTRPTTGTVRFGETAEVTQQASSQGMQEIHEVRLDALKPNTQYFYQVESVDSEGVQVEGETLTFQSAPDENAPFAFATISDTQGNPEVSGQVAQLAWEQRPHFLIHPGDLVSTGTNPNHWLDHFFPSMHVLIGRVPMYPVLGNHEMDAKFYYDYMSLPKPEYYYDFTYSNAHFLMIDSNRKVEPGSEQYQWLEEKLAQSKATWKFVCYHHPPYSSDENDYGDLWKTNKSTRGDLRVRKLVPLFDKYGVDIVWNGHIHSYERTWPLSDGKAVDRQGTIYMITGGGGGSLETPGPVRPWFQNNVRRGHHYCMTYVNGNTLEFKAFDLEGRLFDSMKIEKRNR